LQHLLLSKQLIENSQINRRHLHIANDNGVVSSQHGLDPHHVTTRWRPGYPNKLSRRAKRELIGSVFGLYLQKVKHVEKYTGIRT